ncbi:MAG: DUF4837 family protein [Balneolaceae bacterium]
MKTVHLVIALIILFIVSACNGDYRPQSFGNVDEVIVVMDSTQWNSETALAIEETFAKPMRTLPAAESSYNLTFQDFRNNDELDRLREFKNVIFAAPVDEESNVGSFIRALLSDDVEDRVRSGESFAFPRLDQWVRDQWALILTSTNDQELAEKIRNSEESLVDNLLELEFERRTENLYERGEQVALSDSLWDNHGWSVRMQHDYVQTVDTTNVVVFRRYLTENNRWMWAWWQDDVQEIDFVNKEWINATRDSLMEIYIRGERDESYVTTEYSPSREILTKEMELDSRLKGFETMGTWRMTNDFMGGPFVNFTYYDPETERLFMVEYGQFAPSVSKRRFVRQFQTMGRTFQSDSTWTQTDREQITEFVRE